MKRMLSGFGWLLLLGFGGNALAGSIYAMASGSRGFDAGYAAGAQYAQQYGGIVWLLALLIAVGGTWARQLPGTRSMDVS